MENKNPQNILFINRYTQMGGGEYSMLHLMESMDKKRFTPILLLPDEGPFAEKARLVGIRVTIIKFKPVILPKLLNPLVFHSELNASWELSRFIKEEDIHLIHCTDILSLLLLIPARLKHRIKIYYNVILFLTPLQCLLLNFLVTMMVQRIVATSKAVMAHLLKYTIGLEPKVSVAYNGVDSTVFKPCGAEEKEAQRKRLGIPSGKKVIGLIGRYEVWKGHTTFLRTAELLAAKRSDLLFAIVGGALTEKIIPAVKKYKADFLEQLHHSPATQQFLLLDHQEEIARIIHALDVVVCPSDREAFGLTILEAYASGVPVVASDTVGALEALEGEKGVWIFRTGSAAEFASHIERALSDSSGLIPRKQKLNELPWQQYAREWEKIYFSEQQ